MNTMYPKLKFTYSQKKDLEIFLGFFETNKHFDKSEDFEIGFSKLFPELAETEKMETRKANQMARRVINKEYSTKKEIIKSNLKKIDSDWQKIAPWFFKECARIFNSHPWPKGKYIAYATIWGVYPRFLGDKTFSIPFKHKLKNYPLVVIAHEMLHFIFYDYLEKTNVEIKDEQQLWEMSEIFNVLVQNSENWQKKFRQSVIVYPRLKTNIKEICKKLNSNFVIKAFIAATKAVYRRTGITENQVRQNLDKE